MFDWFNRLPTLLQGVLLVVAFTLLSIAGAICTRPWIQKNVRNDSTHNDRVVFMVEAVGIFYALFLGLVAFGAYDHYNEVKELVNRESAVLGTLYRQAGAYPDEPRCRLQSLIDEYMHDMVDHVWPLQRTGFIAQAGGRTDAILRGIIDYETTTTADATVQSVLFERFGDFSDARRERQMQVEIGVQPVLYVVLFIGAAVIVILTWFLSVDRKGDHLAISGLISGFIGMLLFLIIVLDYPLKQSNSIGSEAWSVALQNVVIEPMNGAIPGCPLTIDQYARAENVRVRG